MSTVGTILLTTWFAFGGLDMWSSLRFKYRGQQEKFKIFTDKYGDFSWWRYALFPVAIATLAVLSEVYAPSSTVFPSWIGVAVLVGLGTFTRFLVAVFKNLKNAKHNREKQWRLLSDLRDHSRWPNNMAGMIDGNRYRWVMTQWIYKDNVNFNNVEQRLAAQQEFLGRLRRAVARPESEWFTEEWFKI